MIRKGRIELGIFFMLFVTYGYFHQGGAWGQNSRFAQVRAVVEEGRFSINNYIAYQAGRDGALKLSRLALPAAEGEPASVSTGDLSHFEGKIYPNKPPGAVLVAVPAYLSIYLTERALGIDPDHWWALTVNAYLTTVFSVGLLAALAGVAFYRISLQLFPSAPLRAHAASTLVFGLATLMLPFATMLYDHDIVAALSLFSLWLLLLHRRWRLASSELVPVFAGWLAGLNLLMHYSSFISVALLTLYAIWVVRPWRRIALFMGAMALPLCFLAWYHWICFGSVFVTASSYQNEFFFGTSGALLFGMFGMPRLDVMGQLLISSYRGLFFTSPVLVLSLVGFRLMAADRESRAEFLLCVVIFLGFLSLNGSFNNWHGGWSMGPRYLIPALPFLSLPLALAFGKLPRLSLTLSALSAVIMLFATAVDPQPFGEIQKPLTDYLWPLAQGKALVLGDSVFQGPVSANPIGVYESWSHTVPQRASIERAWNSFNLGEFLWFGSFLSLVPLLAFWALGLGILWRWTRRSL